MRLKLLEVLACPECFGELSCVARETSGHHEIVTGELNCSICKQTYPIEDEIPRFVERQNYASSFGYQWNRFKSEQIDTVNGTRLSEKRFYSETEWEKSWLKGKWILDAGCGAGRFLDVASKAECEVVGVDLSNATDAARETFRGRENVHLVQASIYRLPFRPQSFDGCYCIGVIQHTPDPAKTLQALPRVLKRGGRLAVTIYERKPWTLLNAKYLIRPFTKRLSQESLLSVIKTSMSILFPITELMFRLPVVGRVSMFVIPVANYVGESKLTLRQRYDWAIMDTFDMLAPQYDQPQTYEEVEHVLRAEGVNEIRRLDNPGLNLVGRSSADDAPSAASDVPGRPF